MRFFKKLLSLLLCTAMLLSLIPGIVFRANAGEGSIPYAVEGGNIYFDKATGTVIDCDYTVTKANIPAEIEGTRVTSIGNVAFNGVNALESITIPDSVTFIGYQSFENCRGLAEVVIPDSVITIAGDAFSNCDNLTSVSIGDSVTDIGYDAFYSCDKLSSIIFGSRLLTIGSFAFAENPCLTDIIIPDSVTTIEVGAFWGCPNLTAITVEKSNGSYCSDDRGVLFDKDKTILVQAPAKIKGSYTIPDGVTTVEQYAFSGCNELTSVFVPDSVTQIKEGAFSFCDNLTGIWVDDDNLRYSSDEHGVLFGSYQTNIVQCPGGLSGRYTFPGTVSSVSSGAFAGCKKLTSVILGINTDAIFPNAFAGCENLTSVTIRCQLLFISYNSFGGCNKLKDVYYYGTEEMWNEINIQSGNDALLNATIHYNYTYTTETPFADVKESDYYYDPVLWAVEKGITNGTGKGKYSPENPCTRGQIVTFLWRANGSPEPTTTENPFTDIASNAYYYKAVLWAVENGITTGTGKGKFSPEDTCTRCQVATFLWRAQGKLAPTSSTNPFDDVDSDAYYYNAILWAVEKGVTNGTGKGKFSPEDSCTRGQIVTFLYRALS